MLTQNAQNKLIEQIKPQEKQKLYAIIDGASIPDLFYLIEESTTEHECLFAGELAAEVERAAPHLIELSSHSQHPLIQTWLQEGWGEHWGIMFHVPSELSFKAIRRHFRKFLRVQLPDKSHVLFRYYDPRVLRVYLPTCNQVETGTIFGPVIHYFAEAKDSSKVLRFKPGVDGAIMQQLSLSSELSS